MKDERGYATVMLAALLGLAVVLCAFGVCVAAIAGARVRASTAADLAALAAARASDCALADQVARLNGAELVVCQRDGVDVIVDVRVPVAVLGRQLHGSAWARAGPP